jgi:O-palmitoleoyl-L-serine hydrolase
VPYCDGSVHQGYTKTPVKYKGSELYFRGAAIFRAHIKWINAKYDLKGASKVLFTGMSAGSVAVQNWGPYVKEIVGDDSKVFLVADSGIFIDTLSKTGQPLIRQQLQNLFKVANVDEQSPNLECNKRYPGEEWRCILVEYAYPFIRGRMLVLSSEYDSWAIQYFVQLDCLKDGVSGFTLSGCNASELALIEQYRSNYKKTLNNFLEANQELSVWSIACSNHVYAFEDVFYDNPHERIPAQTGKTVRDMVEEFVLQGTKNIVIDAEGWPSNTGCAM